MGPYCNYCGQRCFVPRLLPDDAINGWAGKSVILATCPEGMAHDRETCGYTHLGAINMHKPCGTGGAS